MIYAYYHPTVSLLVLFTVFQYSMYPNTFFFFSLNYFSSPLFLPSLHNICTSEGKINQNTYLLLHSLEVLGFVYLGRKVDGKIGGN